MGGTMYRIKEHLVIAKDTRRLILDAGFKAAPGQFVQVSVSNTYDPLLRRPISIHDCSENELHLLYRIVGKGTTLLAEKKAGESLDVLGPLGRGFPLAESREAVLVAGGIGVAPLYYLAKVLIGLGKKVHFFLGAKKSSELYAFNELRTIAPVQTATDDGSAGYHGLVTELFQQNLPQIKAPVIYACGPEVMMREVVRVSSQFQRDCFVSLEAHMACGVGACQGCTVNAGRDKEQPYRRVCVDGPVFRGEEVFRD